MDCRKRKSNITGFIQHLSPQKTSAKGNPYYTLQVQTSSTNAEKILCYSLWKAIEMKKLADIKSPVKIQKLMCHEDGTLLINDYTMAQPMKPLISPFSLRNLIILCQQSLLFLLKFQVYSILVNVYCIVTYFML